MSQKKTTNLTVRLTPEQKEALDEVENATGISRGILMRACVDAIIDCYATTKTLELPFVITSQPKLRSSKNTHCSKK